MAKIHPVGKEGRAEHGPNIFRGFRETTTLCSLQLAHIHHDGLRMEEQLRFGGAAAWWGYCGIYLRSGRMMEA